MQVAALGHRVVHGKAISEPVLIDDAALHAIEDAAELAPLCGTPDATLDSYVQSCVLNGFVFKRI